MTNKLLGKIFNALKHNSKSKQAPKQSDQSQQLPENNTEQPEALQEPSPTYQEIPPEPPYHNDWQLE